MDDSSRAIYLLDKKIIDGSQKSPIVLEISGNSQTILETWRRGVNRGDYKYLKINVSGAGVQSFSYCLFYWLIALSTLFFFPIFLFGSDCIKRRLYMLFNINHNVYEAIGGIIQTINPIECYLVVQDNFFNEAKGNVILNSLQKTQAQKFEFVNIAHGINIQRNNYSDFGSYMKLLGNFSKQSQCRWSRKSAS